MNVLLLSKELLYDAESFLKQNEIIQYTTLCFDNKLTPSDTGFDLDDFFLINLKTISNSDSIYKESLFKQKDYFYLSLIMLEEVKQDNFDSIFEYLNESCAKILCNILAFQYGIVIDFFNLFNFPMLVLQKCKYYFEII